MEEAGRVALVTGAASGIGRAAAARLGAGGAATALVDSNADGLAQTAATIQEAGGTAIAIQADLRADGAAEHAVGAPVEAFGGIDMLVAAAPGSAGAAWWLKRATRSGRRCSGST